MAISSVEHDELYQKTAGQAGEGTIQHGVPSSYQCGLTCLSASLCLGYWYDPGLQTCTMYSGCVSSNGDDFLFISKQTVDHMSANTTLLARGL